MSSQYTVHTHYRRQCLSVGPFHPVAESADPASLVSGATESSFAKNIDLNICTVQLFPHFSTSYLVTKGRTK